jgi:hypothetical protein
MYVLGERDHVSQALFNFLAKLGTFISVTFEELHRALVLLGSLARLERAQIAALAGLRILLPRVQPVFT